MKKLPKVFQNTVIKNNMNNKKYVYGENNEPSKTNPISIQKKISEIFKSSKYIYKMDVEIQLENKVINKKIIAKTKDYLLTMENEKIMINEIKDIIVKNDD
ncbi:MAG: hypothetical protein RSE21_04845 [Bacilli bacterium]